MLPKGVQANETGHATMLDRVKAANKLQDALRAAEIDMDHFSRAEKRFLMDIWDLFEDLPLAGITLSAKQYFWLKDLYDKHVVGT